MQTRIYKAHTHTHAGACKELEFEAIQVCVYGKVGTIWVVSTYVLHIFYTHNSDGFYIHENSIQNFVLFYLLTFSFWFGRIISGILITSVGAINLASFPSRLSLHGCNSLIPTIYNYIFCSMRLPLTSHCFLYFVLQMKIMIFIL